MALEKTPLLPLLHPRGIALFGASPVLGSLGNGLVQNLSADAWASRVYYINPKHSQIGTQRCLASLDQIDAVLTLALIATPLASVPAILHACGRRGMGAAVVYSVASFGTGAPDPHYRLIEQAAAQAKVRLMGPAAMGFILPHSALNTTPISKAVPCGNLAFVSHSNAICAGILDWSHNNEFGFSAIFCPGVGTDLELPEILDFLATDARTETILLYLEGIRDARRFMSAVRAAASVKPVIAVKAGNQGRAVALAQRHCGAASDADDALDAALRRAGVLRVRTIGEMFSAARALSNPCKPQGKRLAVVSNGGGPLVMAADSAAELGIDLSPLSQSTLTRLAQLLPTTWSGGNPVDVLFDADAKRYVGALSACLDDPQVDGVLAVLSPNTFVDAAALARATIGACQHASKPLLSCWLGEMEARAARAAFAQARIPTFRNVESAVAGFSFVVNWVRNQAFLLETPPALSSYREPDTQAARQILDLAYQDGRSNLTEPQSRQLLSAFHIPMAMQGTKLDVPLSSDQVRKLRVQIRRDAVFGPVIALSESGLAGDIYGISSVALPPLNPRLVSAMLSEAHLARLLGPLGTQPAVAQQALRDILLRVSELASELAGLHTLDISTLLVSAQCASVQDVTITLCRNAELSPRYQHMAICPYPTQLVGSYALKDGTPCNVRPIRPEDASLFQEFVRQLSAKSKYFRFFSMINELPQMLLARATQIDYAREITLVASTTLNGHSVMLGEANYATLPDGSSCEFALVVADQMAGKGLGARLMRCLMQAAQQQGLQRIQGEVLPSNEAMLALMEALDFNVNFTDDGVHEVWRTL